MIKAIIFDLDGTLVDSEPLNIRFWCEAMEVFGYEKNEKIIHQVIGISHELSNKILGNYFGDDLAKMRKYKEGKVRNYYAANSVLLKKGVNEILAYLSDKVLLAIATSSAKNKALPVLEKANLLTYFNTIITGDMVINGKPNPEIFIKACDDLKVNPNEVIVVEDSKNGILAARNGGFLSVLIPDIIQPDQEMLDASNYVFSDLTLFHEFLEKLFNTCDR